MLHPGSSVSPLTIPVSAMLIGLTSVFSPIAMSVMYLDKRSISERVEHQNQAVLDGQHDSQADSGLRCSGCCGLCTFITPNSVFVVAYGDIEKIADSNRVIPSSYTKSITNPPEACDPRFS